MGPYGLNALKEMFCLFSDAHVDDTINVAKARSVFVKEDCGFKAISKGESEVFSPAFSRF